MAIAVVVGDGEVATAIHMLEHHLLTELDLQWVGWQTGVLAKTALSMHNFEETVVAVGEVADFVIADKVDVAFVKPVQTAESTSFQRCSVVRAVRVVRHRG